MTSTLPLHDGFQPSSGIPPGAGVPHSPEATMILLVGGMVPGQQPDGGNKAIFTVDVRHTIPKIYTKIYAIGHSKKKLNELIPTFERPLFACDFNVLTDSRDAQIKDT